jgi:heterodisulfide reductase subunit B
MEKMGIDHEQAWAEFETQADRIRAGEIEYMQWEDAE